MTFYTMYEFRDLLEAVVIVIVINSFICFFYHPTAQLYAVLLSVQVVVSQPYRNSVFVFPDAELRTCFQSHIHVVSLKESNRERERQREGGGVGGWKICRPKCLVHEPYLEFCSI